MITVILCFLGVLSDRADEYNQFVTKLEWYLPLGYSDVVLNGVSSGHLFITTSNSYAGIEIKNGGYDVNVTLRPGEYIKCAKLLKPGFAMLSGENSQNLATFGTTGESKLIMNFNNTEPSTSSLCDIQQVDGGLLVLRNGQTVDRINLEGLVDWRWTTSSNSEIWKLVKISNNRIAVIGNDTENVSITYLDPVKGIVLKEVKFSCNVKANPVIHPLLYEKELFLVWFDNGMLKFFSDRTRQTYLASDMAYSPFDKNNGSISSLSYSDNPSNVLAIRYDDIEYAIVRLSSPTPSSDPFLQVNRVPSVSERTEFSQRGFDRLIEYNSRTFTVSDENDYQVMELVNLENAQIAQRHFIDPKFGQKIVQSHFYTEMINEETFTWKLFTLDVEGSISCHTMYTVDEESGSEILNAEEVSDKVPKHEISEESEIIEEHFDL